LFVERGKVHSRLPVETEHWPLYNATYLPSRWSN
jgi:hypothetical protein